MWYYQGEIIEDFLDKEFVGFVYVITNKITNKKYIGKKIFWKSRKYKTKPKRRLVSSDWKTYYGSSKYLIADIEEYGKDNFDREILHMCKSKGDMSYMEIIEQINRKVLFGDDYYNGIINCRIHQKHLSKELKENE